MRLTVLSALVLFAVSTCAAAPLGLRAVVDPPLLAFPPSADVQFLATTAVEGDGNDYKLLGPGQSATIFTVEGPAVIHRIWSTSEYSKETRLVVNLDGREEVVWERQKLPPGQPLGDPLRAMDGESYWSYVPLLVNQRAEFIATDLREAGSPPGPVTVATGNKFYLQVAYTRGTEGMASEALIQQARARLQRLTEDPLDGPAIVELGPDRVPKTETFTLDRNTPVTIQDGENWVIESMVFDAQGVSFEQLRGTRLVIKSDGAPEACVDVPLAYLFSLFWGMEEYEGPYTAVRGDKLVFRFPVPVGKGLEMTLAPFDRGPTLSSLPVTITRGAWAEPPPYRLCAKYRAMISERDMPLRLADINGEGVLVANTFAGNAVHHMRFAYLEGNEQIYVDGATEPTWEGTGTEDFYNGAWYFSAGVNSRAFHGLPQLDPGPPPRMSAYRYLIPDRIAFKESLRFDMQHGSRNSVPGVEYHSVTIWYQKPPCGVEEPAPPPDASAVSPVAAADDMEDMPSGMLELVAVVVGGGLLTLALIFTALRLLRRGRKS